MCRSGFLFFYKYFFDYLSCYHIIFNAAIKFLQYGIIKPSLFIYLSYVVQKALRLTGVALSLLRACSHKNGTHVFSANFHGYCVEKIHHTTIIITR